MKSVVTWFTRGGFSLRSDLSSAGWWIFRRSSSFLRCIYSIYFYLPFETPDPVRDVLSCRKTKEPKIEREHSVVLLICVTKFHHHHHTISDTTSPISRAIWRRCIWLTDSVCLRSGFLRLIQSCLCAIWHRYSPLAYHTQHNEDRRCWLACHHNGPVLIQALFRHTQLKCLALLLDSCYV